MIKHNSITSLHKRSRELSRGVVFAISTTPIARRAGGILLRGTRGLGIEGSNNLIFQHELIQPRGEPTKLQHMHPEIYVDSVSGGG